LRGRKIEPIATATERVHALRKNGFMQFEPIGEASESSDDLRASLLALPERQRLAVFLRSAQSMARSADGPHETGRFAAALEKAQAAS
jgi:hypothetical protein